MYAAENCVSPSARKVKNWINFDTVIQRGFSRVSEFLINICGQYFIIIITRYVNLVR